jgi:Na+/H+ antiporter NhaD/arsenite permease-like protein
MEMTDLTIWVTAIIFAGTILAVITGVVDSSVAAVLGVLAMIWFGTMTEAEAFDAVDWNVMAILVSIWIIAGYLGKTGIPEWLSVKALSLSRGHGGLLVMILSMLAGIISLVVDNVVVILMMAPVAIPIVRHLGIPLTPVILMIGFSSNFMGTALLLGDLPPQMLHSVSGAEFLDFVWMDGRPSSFPILMATFVLTLAIMYLFGFRTSGAGAAGAGSPGASAGSSIGPQGSPEGLPFDARIPDPLFATIIVAGFFATIAAMSLREFLGVQLGFIALTGAMVIILIVELLGHRLKKPEFEEILQELDWRAILFYIGLFALVGGLEKTHLLQHLADWIAPLFKEDLIAGASLLYWVTVPIVGVVEHDAYILTFLYMIRDLGDTGVDPWPLWWMLVWAGTLGSNLTIAGAPALYVALNICEREEKRKVPMKEFLKWSVTFTAAASLICYVFGMYIWVIPNAQ